MHLWWKFVCTIHVHECLASNSGVCMFFPPLHVTKALCRKSYKARSTHNGTRVAKFYYLFRRNFMVVPQ